MTEQSKQGNVNDLRLGHWPHAARRLRDDLDLERLEDQAVRILARATRTQRLVAFVGAGASVAYGRLAWAGLMRQLYDEIDHDVGATDGFKPNQTPVWRHARQSLWVERSEYDDYSDHVIKAQILDMALRRPSDEEDVLGESLRWHEGEGKAQEAERRESVAVRVTNELKDYQGFLRGLARRLLEEGRGPSTAGELAALVHGWREKYRNAKADGSLLEHSSDTPEPTHGLRAVVDSLLRRGHRIHSLTRAEDLEQVGLGWVAALDSHSVGADSPLATVVRDWGVRRFVTTNYDHEIERALQTQGFVPTAASGASPYANTFSSVNFGRTQSAQALKFAFEGPRRHAEILHLHGDVNDPSTLVVTEEEYQRLYLQDHPTRDLVTNAALGVFAANPIFFVGSDAGEDDVLRPMRQFMTGEGHRSDRMAVALFPAIKPRDRRAARAAALLLRHGVHAIYFGWEDAPDGNAYKSAKKSVPEPWLLTLFSLFDEFQKAVDTGKKNLHGRVSACGNKLQALKAPARLDGLPTTSHKELDLTQQVKGLKSAFSATHAHCEQLVNQQARLSGSRGNAAKSKRERLDSQIDGHYRRFLVAFEAFKDWSASAFLCAKLISLRRRVTQQVDSDAKLALIYRRPQIDIRPTPSPQVSFRHKVELRHVCFRGRFERVRAELLPRSEPGHRPFDEGVSDLCEDIRRQAHICGFDGRRVIVVCGARGHGKGGQSDRLLEVDPGQAEDSHLRYPKLYQVASALGGYLVAPTQWRPCHVLHLNLSFSNELGPIISQFAGVLERACPPPEEHFQKRPTDQLEQIERGLRRLTLMREPPRVMIVLGNAGVLFDMDGHPKNGQIKRVLRLLMSPRFKKTPLDILMYVGESQMPAEFRGEATSSTALSGDGRTDLEDNPYADGRPRRRMDRLNIRSGHTDAEARYMVHPLSRTRLTSVAAAYFPELAESLGWTVRSGDGNALRFAEHGSEGREFTRRLYMATGGSRFAMTIALALIDSELVDLRPGQNSWAPGDIEAEPAQRLAQELLVTLSGPPSGSAVERVIEFALDRWEARHVAGKALPMRAVPVPEIRKIDGVDPSVRLGVAAALHAQMNRHRARPTRARWQLASELLWHLGAFGQPVEPEVLCSCPGVSAALDRVCGSSASEERLHVVAATLELLVHWCLIFRVNHRPIPSATAAELGATQMLLRHRYALHRHMQRHVVRLMGGRNVEATQWDQFTVTLYASLPDEAPVLRPEVHDRLTRLLHKLTTYPVAHHGLAAEWSPQDGPTVRELVHQADCIRAAYYLVRSTYSLGVISHLLPASLKERAVCGHMEEYARMVRWITDAARLWEQEVEAREDKQGIEPKLGWLDRQGKPLGIFYAGELVWLYHESGVISLAQGRLNEAEELLNLSEQAARRVEADSTGSLHARIRIHSGLVQLERGRPQRAKQILKPIASRQDGHPVPPQLALFYLGLIEHIGGNYDAAWRHYEVALKNLRRLSRSRAAAFVLINLADLAHRMRPDQVDDALAKANEAISLAQQGGHEDVRHFALIQRARILIEAKRPVGDGEPGHFEILSAAQRYAVRMEVPRLSCEVHQVRAQLLMSQGEYEMSARDASASLEIASLYDLKLKKARGLLTLAQIYHLRRDVDGARAVAHMGREIANACDYYTCVRGFKELELALESAV